MMRHRSHSQWHGAIVGYLFLASLAIYECKESLKFPSAEAIPSEDAVCMLQKVHLEATNNEFNFNEHSNLSAYDKEYVYDAPEGETFHPVEIKISPEALFRLVVATLICILIVLVGVLACLFNSGDGNQKPMAFRVLTHVVASICGLLIYKAVKDVVGHIFYRMTMVSPHAMGFEFALLVILFLVVSAWLFASEASSLAYEMIGIIGMYVIGFAWTNTYQMIGAAKLDAITSSILVMTLLAIVLLSLVSMKSDSSSKDAGFVVTSEERFASMAIGYILSHLLELFITSLGITVIQKNALLNFTIVCLVTASLLMAALTDSGKVTDFEERFSLFARKICLMAAAWCLLDAITWQLSTNLVGTHFGLIPGSKAAALFAAILVSLVMLIVFAAVCIYSLLKYKSDWDKYRIKNVTILTNTMGFVVGSAWANYIIQVIIASATHSQAMPLAVCTAIICLTVCAVIIPVWHYYIKPYEAMHCFMS